MPRYQVTLTHEDTAAERSVTISAGSGAAAMREASGNGWLAVRADLLAAPEVVHTADNALEQIRADVAAIRRSAIVQQPRMTIAWGIVLGMVLWTVMALIVWGLLMLFFALVALVATRR